MKGSAAEPRKLPPSINVIIVTQSISLAIRLKNVGNANGRTSRTAAYA